MTITGPQLQQLHAALLAAYDEAGLEQLCAFELEVDFDAIVGPGPRAERVFNLVAWAKRNGCVADLIATAANGNQTNRAVQALVQAAQDWPVCKAAGLTVYEGRACVFASRQQELAYLDTMLADYDAWAQKYTPLAGIAEVAALGRGRPRVLAPDSFLPPEFALLAREDRAGAGGMVERRPVSDLRKAVREFRRLVVLGEPGSGKTTTLQMLRRDLALAARTDPAAPLPVLVALGGYSGDEPVLAYIMERAGALGRHLPAYLRAGRCVLLLDGLNEMPQRDYGERAHRIQSLLDIFPDVPVAVTCRALDYVEALKLQRLEIEPLDINRRREYLYRYLGEADGDALFWRLAGGEEVAALWRKWERAGGGWEDFWQAEKMPEAVYNKTTVAQEALWARLHSGKLSPLLELSANPYLLAMLIDLYTKGEGQLPQNRARLFGGFVAVLLAREAGRRRSSGAAWPGDDVLRAALARLAFTMQSAGERGTAVERAWATDRLGDAGCPADAIVTAAAGATLLDLSSDRVRFVHQLLQEYFAAIGWQARLAAGDDLRNYWPDGWTAPSGWEETALLLAGHLPDLAAFIEQLLPVNPPLAARCLAESGVHPQAQTISVVQTVLIEIAGSLSAPVKQRVTAGDALNYLGDPRPGVGVKDGLPDILWCSVPAGPFLMGNNQETDSMAYNDVMPQQVVDLPAFAISQYPITNAQYQAFVDDRGYTQRWQDCWTAAGWQWKEENSIQGPRRFGGDFDPPNHPVVGVSWYEAVAFCRWLAQKLGQPIQLPTEAQWEKAARGTDGRRYPWGQEITPEHANYDATGIGATSSVGVFPQGQSPYGLQDAAGNVWEWTTTKWTVNYLRYLPDDDLDETAQRVLRGGAFVYDDNYVRCDNFVRCAARDAYLPYLVDRYYGFRVVLSTSPLRSER